MKTMELCEPRIRFFRGTREVSSVISSNLFLGKRSKFESFAEVLQGLRCYFPFSNILERRLPALREAVKRCHRGLVAKVNLPGGSLSRNPDLLFPQEQGWDAVFLPWQWFPVTPFADLESHVEPVNFNAFSYLADDAQHKYTMVVEDDAGRSFRGEFVGLEDVVFYDDIRRGDGSRIIPVPAQGGALRPRDVMLVGMVEVYDEMVFKLQAIRGCSVTRARPGAAAIPSTPEPASVE